MDTPKNELRQRLRELLSTPERERTDAQWDEIIELEIRLAPGNQIDSSGGNSNDQASNGQNFRPRPPNKGHQNQRKQGQGRRPNKGYPPRSGGGGGGGNAPPQSTPQSTPQS